MAFASSACRRCGRSCLYLHYDMNLKRIILTCSLALCALLANAQSYSEIGAPYPLKANGDRQVVSGFIQFNSSNDETIFANALLLRQCHFPRSRQKAYLLPFGHHGGIKLANYKETYTD